MRNILRVEADIKGQRRVPAYTVTQNDSVSIVVTVLDGGSPVNLDEVSTMTIACTRRDGAVVVKDGTQTGPNEVTFDLGTSEIEQTGKVDAVIQLYSADSRVSTIKFSFMVTKDPTGEGYVPSEDERTLIEVVLGDGPLTIERAETAAANAEGAAEYIDEKKPLIDKFTDEQTSLQAQLDEVARGATNVETSQARVDVEGTAHPTLKARLDKEYTEVIAQLAQTEEQLDKTYSFSETFDPIVVAREKGRHIAFGSIERVADLINESFPNRNLIVYRNGLNHQNDGFIRGIYVSDDGYPLGEPFTIASSEMFPNIGRGGNVTPNDFRDPNLLRLPDGRILLTFFAIYFEADATRTQVESYAMIGNFDYTNKTLNWTAPSLLLNEPGHMIYGKPIIDGNYVMSATYTYKAINGKYKGNVIRASLSDPLNWSIVGNPVFDTSNYQYTEPVLRKRPGGGYFVQARHEYAGAKEIVRFDADTLNSDWSNPIAIYKGSTHAKGLEILDDGSYFTGIRLLTERPGIAILTTDGSAETPVPLQLSGVVSTAQTSSSEGGYMEFMKLKDEEYLGMFHTEQGRTIQCFRFSVSMIRNKKVKEEDSAFPIKKQIGAERINPLIHLGNHAIRSHNLLTNPLAYIPYGFSGAPGWSGTAITKSDGAEADSPGVGYGKVTTSGGSVTSRVKQQYSRLYAGYPVVAAARVYCKSPNRVRLAVTFGTQVVSAYHNGEGWETLVIKLEQSHGYSFLSNGTKDDDIMLQFISKVGDSFTYYIDWASLGFGETIPEVINDSSERMFSLVRLPLTAKTNTFNLADLGFPSPASALMTYSVNILDSTFEILGYSVSKTTTTFTITLTDGSPWGSNKFAVAEVVGIG